MPVLDYHGNPCPDPDTLTPGSTTYALWFLSDLHLGALVRAGCSTLVSREEADAVLNAAARDESDCLIDLPGLSAEGSLERRRLMTIDPHHGPRAVEVLDRFITDYKAHRAAFGF